MSQKIIMDVPLKGLSTNKAVPKFETQGFVGDACTKASDFLVKALGSAVEDVPTPEMYDVEKQHERLTDYDG